nr:dienelactone hydrolase family protein [Acidiplasma sp.]
MGLYAGEDHRITSKTPELLEKLIEYNKPVTIKVYSGTYHAFFNNTRPQIYNEKASNDAWEMSLKFFESNLF